MATVKGKRQAYVTDGGDVVTPAIEEELADEAERGYDLSKGRRRFLGRPPLGDGGTSPRVTFRFPQAQFNAVRQRAEDEGRTVSSLAREALIRYMDTDS
ncbi:MAG TPA: hypothetical protein VFU16_09615 [Solirubrobacterales bacterium]|nr:hypothetical protein [Solirubrobacterales bacterium]